MLEGRRASIELQVRLSASDGGVLVWLGAHRQSRRRPLVTLEVVDGRLLLNWRLLDHGVSLTASNNRRIDDNRWHAIRAYR